MLSDLHIENIAVIESADIEFSSGLNVLTGETGAGKSIIIDSINAVLGNRTSKELVRTGADNALVSAVFKTSQHIKWFNDNDIEQEEEIILQRRINAEGKSSCRVSGVPVTAAQLRELASQLVDIHGQNDGLRLLDEKAHLGFLDSFSDTKDVYHEYYEQFRKLVSISKEIKSLSMDDVEKERLSESLKYKIDELSKAQIVDGEYASLKSKHNLLHNSEKLKESLDEVLNYLSGIENSAVSDITNAVYHLQRASSISPNLEEQLKELNNISFDICNVNETISDIVSSLDFSEEEYNEMENRINFLDRLQRKYGCDEAGLIDALQQAYKQLDDIEYSDDKLVKLRKDFDNQKNIVWIASEKLTAARKEGALKLEEQIIKELRDLNMPSVRFKVDFQQLPKFSSSGIDDVKFLMSANAGEELGRISKIASGGELSRIMLALKNVFAKNDVVDTMIFDEVDTGVSGISALRVAEKLYSVSNNKQVLCISHLPQIAAIADSQYLVSKTEFEGRTFTNVQILDASSRIKEIARLYGGDNISEATLAAAEDQLNKAKEYKEKQIK